ncbi:hypothetical protein [Bradyrhizobium sp. 2S1]|uniref:hypothetical protein n=1 Tax=Bradyrhizobium sp. 2S1 TaxID=1404429 RepID=UPI001407B189|nr:hypothetical protein [Bradyrhizobium sp. 2S1]MCK7666761.1 hypothetical protein [Bradyrhizobium sp. 2S1]
MKRIVIVAALLMSAAVQAHADQLTVRWYDTIRPHGHKRPNAVGMAAVSACNQRLGEPDQGYIPEAFKDCMRGFGYRFMSDTLKRSGRPATVYNRDSRDPSSVGTPRTECGCATTIAIIRKSRAPVQCAGTST